MIWFFKTFWRSLSFLSFLVGLLFLASDVGELPVAIADWRAVLRRIDLTVAFGVFSFCALAYIIWIDARPYVSRWRKSDRYDVSVHAVVAWTAAPLGEIDGSRYYENHCYLPVYNNGRSKRTAHSVRVSRYILGTRFAGLTDNGQTEVDLHHGETVLFHLGSVVSGQAFGLVTADRGVTEKAMLEAKHNVSRGHYTFKVGEMGIAIALPGVTQAAFSRNPLSFMSVRVAARDLPTISVRLQVDQDELSRTEGSLPNPVTITEVRRD